MSDSDAVHSDIPITQTQTDTDMTGSSKTHTETETETEMPLCASSKTQEELERTGMLFHGLGPSAVKMEKR